MNRKLLIPALYAFPLSLILALMIGPILRDGMFKDGLVYTNIARNMADGLGGFWTPMLDRLGPIFFEHPPLLFWIESLFFRAFGDHLWTEDMYNFVILGGTIGVMYGIWRALVPATRRQLFFFPLLLWVLSQEVQLRYPNAMLECGMTLVLLLTAWSFLRLLGRGRGMQGLVVGVGSFLAVLCKGPAGLFLLAMPALHGLIVERRFNVWEFVVAPVVCAACFGLLFLLEPAALEFFTGYLDKQVFAALRGERMENIADSRLDILWAVLLMNLPAFVLCGLPRLIRPGEEAGSKSSQSTTRYGYLFLAIAASAVLPLMVSIKQASYYQLPALPFLFIGLGLLLAPRAERMVAWLGERQPAGRSVIGLGAVGLIATTVFALSMFGTLDRRDTRNVANARAINAVMVHLGERNYNQKVLGKDAAFASPTYYNITGYLNRLYALQYDPSGQSALTLYLLTEGAKVPEGLEVLYRADEVMLVRKR